MTNSNLFIRVFGKMYDGSGKTFFSTYSEVCATQTSNTKLMS